MTAQAPAFRGRERERAELDELLQRVREGESAALVLRGEAGIGKTALMHYCARQAAGCRVVAISGVESELEMPFAALHQVCGPVLDAVDALPEPQQDAIRVAFGLAVGNTPDRFLVGLAVLGLLAEVAADRPLVCLVDDAQWLDEPSRQVLGFVGRRLQAEAVLLVFAVRGLDDHPFLLNLPTMRVDGLSEQDARALLMAAVPRHLDDEVRDRIVAETRGNPLALLELPRAMGSAELAGGFGMPSTKMGTGQLESHYAQRIDALPESAQRLMLLAAADATGDAALLWRAAQTLGIARSAADAAESDHLFAIGSRVRFRHPLVRAAAYAAGSDDDRRSAHLALAEAMGLEDGSERRVWHLAVAATGPDDALAAELEQTAATAQARAGLAAAGVFLELSARLTVDLVRRVERTLGAADAYQRAGELDKALGLLAEGQALATNDLQLARIERLRGAVQWAARPGGEAPSLLVEAAKRLEALDARLAREIYLDAWFSSLAAGPYAHPGGRLPEVSRAAQAVLQSPVPPTFADVCLDGFVTFVIRTRAESAASLRAGLTAFLVEDLTISDWLQWGHVASTAAALLWDWKNWEGVAAKHVELARDTGALASLSVGLDGLGIIRAQFGDLESAAALRAEYNAVKDATGIGWYATNSLSYLELAAYEGRADALPVMSGIAADSAASGLGIGAQAAMRTMAILLNSLGRYGEAFETAKRAAYEKDVPFGTIWAIPELVEAAVRTRELEVARDAVDRLAEHTLADSDWAKGLEAQCRALVTEGEEAERWYCDAIDRLTRTAFRTHLSRTHLLYGEWLRREGRRVDARHQLTSAYDIFCSMGAEAFAERTRRELLATGEKVRKRDVSTQNELTPQEEHIARLARDGRSNAEIAAELFLSVRTVEWHLRKVFMKLGIASRKELNDAMWSGGRSPSHAS